MPVKTAVGAAGDDPFHRRYGEVFHDRRKPQFDYGKPSNTPATHEFKPTKKKNAR